jgi:hypothetical protein
MATIEIVPIPGGSARVGVLTRDHCPPHATCRDAAGQWTARFQFSFIDSAFVGLLDIIPQQSSPGSKAIHDLEAAVRRNLPECRRLWWNYQRNNPQIQTHGACCLNNVKFGGYGSNPIRTIDDAEYDPGTLRTRLRFTDGTTLSLPL